MIILERKDNYYRLVLNKGERLSRDEIVLLNKINNYKKIMRKSILKIVPERVDNTNNLNLECEVIKSKSIKDKDLSIELDNETFVNFVKNKEINLVFKSESYSNADEEIRLKRTGFEVGGLARDIDLFNEFLDKVNFRELESYNLVCIYETKLIYTNIKVKDKTLDDIRDDLMKLNMRGA